MKGEEKERKIYKRTERGKVPESGAGPSAAATSRAKSSGDGSFAAMVTKGASPLTPSAPGTECVQRGAFKTLVRAGAYAP